MASARLSRTAIALGLLALGWLAIVWASRSAERPAVQAPARPQTALEWYAQGKELAAGSRDLPAAIDAYRAAIALAPDFAEAHYGLGLAFLQNGDAVGAAAEIESALSLAPEDAPWRKDAEAALAMAYVRKANPGAR